MTANRLALYAKSLASYVIQQPLLSLPSQIPSTTFKRASTCTAPPTFRRHRLPSFPFGLVHRDNSDLAITILTELTSPVRLPAREPFRRNDSAFCLSRSGSGSGACGRVAGRTYRACPTGQDVFLAKLALRCLAWSLWCRARRDGWSCYSVQSDR